MGSQPAEEPFAVATDTDYRPRGSNTAYHRFSRYTPSCMGDRCDGSIDPSIDGITISDDPSAPVETTLVRTTIDPKDIRDDITPRFETELADDAVYRIVDGMDTVNGRPFSRATEEHFQITSQRTGNTILSAVGKVATIFDDLPLPPEVEDSFTEWIDRGFVQRAKDQLSCGGCWAFATCNNLGTCARIATNGQWSPPWGLSEQYLISCGNRMGIKYASGCDGAIPYYAFEAMRTEGVPIDRDDHTNRPVNFTYYQTRPSSNDSCSLRKATATCDCDDVVSSLSSKQTFGGRSTSRSIEAEGKYRTVGEPVSLVRHNDGPVNRYQSLNLWPQIPPNVIAKNVNRMKRAIYYNGPITCGYQVTSDFNRFVPTPGNYYVYDGRSPMEYGHAATIVGWKRADDSTPVWIVENSWGDKWGYGFDQPLEPNPSNNNNVEPKYRGGFWNHRMGTNESYIESNASTAFIDLTHPALKQHLPTAVSEQLPRDYPASGITLRSIYERFTGPSVGQHTSGGSSYQNTTQTSPYLPVPLSTAQLGNNSGMSSTTSTLSSSPQQQTTNGLTLIPSVSTTAIQPLAVGVSQGRGQVLVQSATGPAVTMQLPPGYRKIDITNKFVITDVDRSKVTSDLAIKLLSDPATMYLIAGLTQEQLNIITAVLPSRLDTIEFTTDSFVSLKTILEKTIRQQFFGLVIKASSELFFFMAGTPGTTTFKFGQTKDARTVVSNFLGSIVPSVGQIRLLKLRGADRGIVGLACSCNGDSCKC